MSEPTRDVLLVLNCGSSSIKFAVFDAGAVPLPRRPLWNGKVQGIGGPAPDFGETDVAPFPIELGPDHLYRDALALIRQRVLARLDGRGVAAIAHRVVHGGSKYFDPVRVDAQVLADLKGYIPLAPLHQPFALEAIEILLRERPDIAQVACFDTGFHHTLPEVEQVLPLPTEWRQRGLRRYGFHGLSYDYIATALPERHGDAARGRTIVAHLGSGASLCAMRDLESVATTMGFSALDGLMMGTRTGALVAVLGGLDMLVFTAGVGEHNDFIRERVCAGLAFLGVRLDAAANAGDAPIVSVADSRVLVGVEPTNEEWVAARDTCALLATCTAA